MRTRQFSKGEQRGSQKGTRKEEAIREENRRKGRLQQQNWKIIRTSRYRYDLVFNEP